MSRSTNRTSWKWAADLGVEVLQPMSTKIVEMGKTPRPTRGLFADTRIKKGSLLAVVPASSAFHGSTAASAAAEILGSSRARDELVNEIASVSRGVTSDVPVALASRDPLLMAAVLVLDRAMQRPHRFRGYCKQLPPRMPRLGPLLNDALRPASKEEPSGGVSPAMLRDFFDGRSMTRSDKTLQPAEQMAVDDAGFGEVLTTHRVLEERVIDPLGRVLRDAAGPAAEDGSAEPFDWHGALRWAHFLVRSRSVNAPELLGAPKAMPTPVVAPVLDLVNHSTLKPNVGFTTETSSSRAASTIPQNQLNVIATSDVEAGEQLTTNYGVWGQRLKLFSQDGSDEQAVSGGGKAKVSRRNRDEVHRSLRRIDDEQRFVLLPGSEGEAGAAFMPDGGTANAAQAAARPTTLTAADRAELRAREGLAIDSAAWVFHLGFAKTEEEELYEASCVWHAGLVDRISRLTDARRKGRAGEFVVGVPEGLRALREERRELQRKRYGGKHVFPDGY